MCRTAVGKVPWFGRAGRQEVAFNHIFDLPMVRHCRAPRPALDPRCERSHRVVAFRAARPSHPVRWLGGFGLSCPASGWSVHRTATSVGPGSALACSRKVRSRPPPSNPAPDRPFTPVLTLCRWLSRADTVTFLRVSQLWWQLSAYYIYLAVRPTCNEAQAERDVRHVTLTVSEL